MGTLLRASNFAESCICWIACQTGLSAPCSGAGGDPPLPGVIHGLGRARCGSPPQGPFLSASSLQSEGSQPSGKASRAELQGQQLHPSQDGPSIMENACCNETGAVGTCLHGRVPRHLLKPTLHQSVHSSGDGTSASS